MPESRAPLNSWKGNSTVFGRRHFRWEGIGSRRSAPESYKGAEDVVNKSVRLLGRRNEYAILDPAQGELYRKFTYEWQRRKGLDKLCGLFYSNPVVSCDFGVSIRISALDYEMSCVQRRN